jgi:Erv1 / Alr family
MSISNSSCSGECAGHFRQILAQYPPQTSSRSSAAAWACHVHNVVNKSLMKPIFDCSKIGDFYKCGCAEEEEGSNKSGEKGGPGESKIAVQTAKQVEDGENDLVPDSPKGARMKLEREG